MRKKKIVVLVLLLFIFSLMMSLPAAAASKKNGWYQKGSYWYYAKNGKNKTGWVTDKGYRYYLQKDKKGRMAVGWLKLGSRWYYLQPDLSPVGAMKKGWLQLDNKKYYLSKKNGVMYTGKKKIGKSTYQFASSGELIRKLTKPVWKSDSKGTWYDNGDGTYPKAAFKTIEGKTYYFDNSGYVVKGWQKIKESIYYFDAEGALVKGTWVITSNKQYFVGRDGILVTNSWVDNRYVGPDGFWIKDYQNTKKKKNGWYGDNTTVRYHQNNSAAVNWRYFKNGKPLKGLRLINRQYYYFESDGYMRVGWMNKGGFRYFMNTIQTNKIGTMVTGWLKIDGGLYYFFPSGKMAKGQTLLASDNKYYTFNKNGKCTKIVPK